MGKSHKTTLFTLIVIETCVKNCGKPFHLLVNWASSQISHHGHNSFYIPGVPKRFRKWTDKPSDRPKRWCFNRHSGQGFLIMMAYSIHVCKSWTWILIIGRVLDNRCTCNASHGDIIIKIIQDYLLMISFKVLSLIQSWAHAFSPDPDLRGVAEVSLANRF